MSDRHSQRLTTSLAGSSISPTLPLHETRSQEEGARRERSHHTTTGPYALDEIGDTRSRHTLPRIKTTLDNDGTDFGERDSDRQHHMPQKKSKSRSPNPRGRQQQHQATGSTSSSAASPATQEMNGSFRERTKHVSSLDVPEDSASQTARLMGRSSFSLDDIPPPTTPLEKETGTESGSKGFFELPEQDRRNFLLLVLLYFLQGIPMGLAGGSVPFLLKSHLSYGQIGVYSLASYPYSLKLLWSPIVDAIWSQRVGRRKSWILPIQTLSGLGMLWLGSGAQKMMEQAGENNGAGVWGVTGWWFALVFMCATQDIAVDGKELPRGSRQSTDHCDR